MHYFALGELMALQTQTVSVALGQGMDTKTDKKVTAKPVLLKDAIFTQANELAKRNGYDEMAFNIVGGGTITKPTMSKSYRSELVCAATGSGSSGQRLFAYSESLNAWVDRGKYLSVAVGKQFVAGLDYPINAEISGTQVPSCAVSGNIALYAYYDVIGASVLITVVDLSTGTQIVNNMLIQQGSSNPMAILLGSGTLAVIYQQASTAYVVMQTVSVTSAGGVVLGSATTLISSPTVAKYDAFNTSSGMVMCYVNSTAVDVQTVNTSGTITHTASISAAGAGINPLSINSDVFGNVWVYWATGTNIQYAVFDASLNSLLGQTTAVSGFSNTIGTVTAASNGLSQQTVYFSTFQNSSGYTPSSLVWTIISQQTVSMSGPMGSATTFLKNVDIYSRPVAFNNSAYMAVMFISPLASTGMIVDLADGVAIAKFLPLEAEGLQLVSNATRRSENFLNSLIPISSTELLLAAGIITSLSPISNTTKTGPSESANSAIVSTVSLTFDFNNIDAYQGLVQQDTLALNGGIVSQYDSAQVSELGFTIDPDGIAVNAVSTGGSFSAGTWVYYVTYEWLDALGNLHQSAPSNAFYVVFASGTTGSVTVAVQLTEMTQKNNVSIVLWRTTNAGQIAYRLASTPNTVSSSTQLVVTFTDDYTNGTQDDATIATGPSLYTQAGAILENLAPPPAMVMWTNNNRLWVIDSENPETTIEPSKAASQGSGISFSTGQLTIIVDSKGGAIKGASPMDEKTVLLKENSAGYFIGDAANDAGGGETISNFQFIPSDTGCSNSKSVVLYPNGILFRSSDNKGIYQVSRGLQISYFGMDVEAYNSQDIQSAFIIPNRNQIRFLTSNGSSLVYDYVMNQWGVFTNHAGLSADQFNGLYVYVRSTHNAQDNGAIFLEDESSFLDNATAYAPGVILRWIKASSVQNFERCREIAILGDYTNGSSAGHGLQVSVAYDFGTTFSQLPAYYFGASSSSGAFQVRAFMPRQKCNAFQIQIQEITTGASGEFIDLTDLGLEIGTKRGLNKLPAAQSI